MSEVSIDKISCPCKRLRCPRHGECAACRAYHASDKKSAPACEREQTRVERRAAREARRDK